MIKLHINAIVNETIKICSTNKNECSPAIIIYKQEK